MQDFRRFLRYLRPHRAAFAIALAAMVFNALFESAVFALIVPILDQAFGEGAKKRAINATSERARTRKSARRKKNTKTPFSR